MLLFFIHILFWVALAEYVPKESTFLNRDVDSKIVGGVRCEIEDAPYIVAVLRKSRFDYYQVCGGSIISPSVVVSAAHCIENTTADEWRIQAGSTVSLVGGQFINITKIIMHELYGSNPTSAWDYDIGLLFTIKPIFIDGVSTAIISLPLQDQIIDDGTIGQITGWGAINEGAPVMSFLRRANNTVVNQELCSGSYVTNNRVTDRMMCVGDYYFGGVDGCQGDSGGPFAVDNKLIGIISWGLGCGRPRYPGVYTRVSSFRDWIDGNIETELKSE